MRVYMFTAEKQERALRIYDSKLADYRTGLSADGFALYTSGRCS